MARLIWGAVGERFYEAGVDRGVLYPPVGPGVPWNGLLSVQETPTGGEPQPYYIDGYKYLNVSAAEEFKATLTTLSAPDEFNQFDGVSMIHNGLFATHQPRKTFGLSYRSKIGNDISGSDLGYKLHLVYNAMASPSSRENKSEGSSTEPMRLSWGISTRPPIMSSIKPTAHLIIDSRYTDPSVLVELEDILYGTMGTDPQLPAPSELITLFTS